MQWTDERRAECVELWNSGKYSMGQIASHFQTTRNAISGLLDRAKGWGYAVLTKKSDEIMIRVRERSSAANRRIGASRLRPVSQVRPVGVSAAAASENFNPPLRKNLLELGKGECKFPYGESNFSFCGYPTDPGKSFCPTHHKICWQSPRR